MKINANFDQRVVVHSEQLPWVASPMAGVSRRALDRVGQEVARATTIVKYEPGSHFSPHVHTGGEEFIVLEGVFQDEHGDFPVGSYIRNPPQSRHKPGSEPGCVIFVKLWQFNPDDRQHIRTDLNKATALPWQNQDGVNMAPLYQDDTETVALFHLSPGAQFQIQAEGGAEVLVLEGEIAEKGDTLGRHSWLRLPPGDRVDAMAASEGSRIWVKTGHLAQVDDQIQRVLSLKRTLHL